MPKGLTVSVHSVENLGMNDHTDFSTVYFASGDADFSVFVHGDDHIAKAKKLLACMKATFTPGE